MTSEQASAQAYKQDDRNDRVLVYVNGAFFPRDKANPWGWQDITAWARYERWMRANHLLTRPPSESPPLTNEFLAGQGAGAGQ